MNTVLDKDNDYKDIYNKYYLQLARIGIVRNHQEHISEGRLDGYGHKHKPLSEPNSFGILSGDEYNFGGDKFNLEDAYKTALDLEGELKVWNKKSQVYPLW